MKGTILNTRTRPNSGALTAALTAAGFDVSDAPLLQVEPTNTPAPERADEAETLFVTSIHAVPMAARYNHLPAYAVGATTAQALRDAGVEDVRVGPGDGRGLSDMLVRDGTTGPVLYPGAETVSFDAIAHWRDHGITGLAWPVYRTVPAPLDTTIAARLLAGGFDHIIVTSARSAKALAAHAPDAVGATEIAVLSPRIKAALPSSWQARTSVATEPNETALLSLMQAV